MTVPTKAEASRGEIMESVIIKGDLGKLHPEERATYYMKVCQSIGLNPLTRPLEYITLNGKLTLYAKRDCADQLRKIHGISVAIVSQDRSEGLLTVHVRAKDQTGREDEDLGVVSLPDTLKGEARANAILKAVTKAKRRVTLSISGLGFLDETEVEDIPASAKRAAPLPALEPTIPDEEQISEEISSYERYFEECKTEVEKLSFANGVKWINDPAQKQARKDWDMPQADLDILTNLIRAKQLNEFHAGERITTGPQT